MVLAAKYKKYALNYLQSIAEYLRRGDGSVKKRDPAMVEALINIIEASIESGGIDKLKRYNPEKKNVALLAEGALLQMFHDIEMEKAKSGETV